MKILRGYYTEHVVEPIQKTGEIKAHYLHRENDRRVPLPATMIHELSELFTQEGISLDLYSAYPFPHRSKRKLDTFEPMAWDALSTQPDAVFSQSLARDGREFLRVAIADVMQVPACVSCHNAHPDTPKKDWALGDVRGVLEMQIDLTENLASGREFGWLLAFLVAATTLVGSAVLFFSMRKSLLAPMLSLSGAAQSCAAGNTSISIEGTSRSDEIGALAKSLDVFRLQAKQVQSLNEELEAHRSNLEQRVSDRTAELAQKEVHLRTAMDNMPGGMVLLDGDGNYVLVNEKYRELHGYPDDFPRIGQSYLEEVEFQAERGDYGDRDPEELAGAAQAALSRVLSGGDQIIYERELAPGNVLEFSIAPATTGGVVAVAYDITERKKAEEAVAAKEAQLRLALENMPGSMFVVDRDLRIVLMNDTYRDYYGDPDGLARVGNSIRDVLKSEIDRGILSGEGSPDEILEQRIRSYRTDTTLTFEDRTPDGRYIQLTRTPAPEGQTVSVAIDITKRKLAEAAKEDAHAVMRDSIQYASRIQRSLLPNAGLLGEVFAEHFCLWEPRDVVGGDMYWVKKDRRGYFVVLFDCTGHGVPGALMTTIAVSALNIAFAETGDPSRLMMRVNQIVKDILGQVEKKGLADDGLEMGVCHVEPERMRLTYSGARFELLSAVGDQIEITKGDKSGLGYRHVPLDQRFTNHSIRLRRGQRIYMYTDGVIDQVGGEKCRAFGRKRLIEVLKDASRMPLEKHQGMICRALADYQGPEKRRDDVAIIGFAPIG